MNQAFRISFIHFCWFGGLLVTSLNGCGRGGMDQSQIAFGKQPEAMADANNEFVEVRSWLIDENYGHGEVLRPGVFSFVRGKPLALCVASSNTVGYGGPSRVILFDYVAGKQIRHYKSARIGYFMRLSPDGNHLVYRRAEVGVDTTIVLYDTQHQRIVRASPDPHETIGIEWFPDSKRFLSMTKAAAAEVWNIDIAKGATGHVFTLGKGEGGAPAAAVLPDGKRVVTADASGRMTVWDLESRAIVCRSERMVDPYWRHVGGGMFECPPGSRGMIPHVDGTVAAGFWHLSVSPDGKVAVAGASNGILGVFATDTGRLLDEHREADAWADDITSVDVSSNGERVLFSTTKGTARVWERSSGRITTLTPASERLASEPPVRVELLTFSGDNRAALACDDGTIRLWKLPE